MSLTVALCFSDPIYGIRQSESNTSTPAFLYWDASYYFSLELVHPYVRVAPTTWTAPQPSSPAVSAFSPDSNFVDWSLATMILGLSFLGIVLLIQRVSPSSSWRNQWLYKLQRWFFDPTHHNYDEKENEELQRASESRPLGGQDNIPYSMGGGHRISTPSPLYVGSHFRRTRALSRDALFRHHSSSTNGMGAAAAGGDGASATGELEMVAQASVGSVGAIGDSSSDIGDDEFMDETSVVSSHRLFRDPELVELPDLTSSSKVAIPVSLQRTTSGNFSIE